MSRAIRATELGRVVEIVYLDADGKRWRHKFKRLPRLGFTDTRRTLVVSGVRIKRIDGQEFIA